MHHRDRAAPWALARDQPIAQAIIHRAFADTLFFQPRGDFAFGGFDIHAIEETRIGELSGAGICLGADRESFRIGIFRHDDGRDGEFVFAGEIEIALVVRGAAEDRAGAIAHQHEVRDIDRQLPVRIERMDRR